MNALRELAERWIAEAARGVIRGEDVPTTLMECAGGLLQILDAESEYGEVPVAWLCVTHDGSNSDAVVSEFARDTYRHTRTITPLYTQPVRSGVVSDEQAKESSKIFWSILGDPKNHLVVGTSLVAMRAALEHFAKSQGAA